MTNPYIGLFLGGLSLITVIVAMLWLVLARTARNRRLHFRDAALSDVALEDHAKTTALGHAVSSRRSNLDWPLPRLNDNYDVIQTVYKELNEDVRKKRSVPPAAEWLLDNFYVLEEQVKGLRQDLKKKDFRRLPVLTTGTMKGYARIVAISIELVSHTDGQISEAEINRFLNAYQTSGTLTDRELWALPTVLRIALIENIRQLCETIQITRARWQKADALMDSWFEHGIEDQERATRMIQDSLKSAEEANPSFVEHLFFRLRRSGHSYAHILRIMDERLIKYNATTDGLTQTEHRVQSLHTQSMGNTITSLHALSAMDWSAVFEAASSVEQTLRTDPDGTYPLMDQQSRNHYRRKVEEIAALHGVPELYIAREAIAMATEAITSDPDNARSRHVGDYLLGKGLKPLEERQEQQGFHRQGRRALSTRASGILYIGSIGLITLLFTALAFLFAYLATGGTPAYLWILSGLVVLIPASEIATGLVNWVVCKALKPAFFPRLAFKEGIPESCSTIVVVPTLLPDEDRVDELLRGLECHYLSNRDDNLFFALIGGFMDADRPNPAHDRAIVDAALSGVVALNRKYAGPGPDRFYYFQRENRFNETNNKWIGWERKRGALMEFNELVQGSKETSFTHASHDDPPFGHVRYIITLDSDTILPMGMARKMIGTMAHPLNRPVIDPVRGVVVAGYGLMQPRIDVELESSNRSQFSRIFTAQEGLDPYANAISDVYQDLFGEGIYTGKGIYDLEVFQKILKPAVPDNTILSHDLMEGSYVRTGLVTDLKLVDAHPSKYNSHAARQHRWVRGDWQLLPLLFSTILNFLLHRISNPLSLLSRWKILDNLRRSLVAPSLLLLVGLSFTILPGSIAFWLGFFFLTQGVPLLTSLVDSLFARRRGSAGIRKYMPTMIGMKAALLQRLIMLAFLPHQAWSMLVAIVVTWIRVRITGKNLLQWVTSADVEKSQKNTPGAYLKMMIASPFAATAILALAALLRPDTAWYFLPLFGFWILAPWLAFQISQDVKPPVVKLTEADRQELGRISRRTWRYFEDFADGKSHFLAPDNHQIDPPRGTAFRTSPTNIGLGLMAILSARDFGYVGTAEMMDLVSKTVATMERMETWNGHLLNWYDTRTLQPLRPRYVSTVDSGNLACYLIVLEQGLREHLHTPLLDASFTSGLRDTLACAGAAGLQVFETISSSLSLPGNNTVNLSEWADTLRALIDGPWLDPLGNSIWKEKILHDLRQREWELREWMPAIEWMAHMPAVLRENPAFQGIPTLLSAMMPPTGGSPSLSELPDLWQIAAEGARSLSETIMKTPFAAATALPSTTDDTDETGSLEEGLLWLTQLEVHLRGAAKTTRTAVARSAALQARVRVLADNMRFTPLYDPKRQLFSIGFDLDNNKRSKSYYDLLASEARQTSYLCIARGEIPETHWGRMGRALTVVDGYKGLISWTGTMFEYLMPLLIMKSYDNTLLDETYSFVIRSQKKYGRQRDMPWGTSESGFNAIDASLDYQYKAIGVPWLGLKRGLIEDAVTAPYATFLALLVNPAEAFKNIVALREEGLDGPYGFYEAADYTPERLPFNKKRAIVKSYMAHHQGMSLMALGNFLHGNNMQERFHSDPAIHAARLLLQEKIPNNLLFTKDAKEKVIPFKESVARDASPMRRFTRIDPELPKAHILTNGNYTVMLTDRGTGYSRNKMMALTRWRSDTSLDAHGMFFYLRHVETGRTWSATQAPLPEIPSRYEVVFTADKATYHRVDGDISTETEVVVTSEDNAEIRRISLKNSGPRPITVEVTSCFEVVLAPQAADVAHPAFSNLFVQTGWLPEQRCLVANRRPRAETDKESWLAHALICEGDIVGDVQYETDRMQWLGRGRNMSAPILQEHGKPLTNTTGAVLDPVMSLRATIRIEPGKTASLSFLTAVAGSNELLLALVDRLGTPEAVEGAFRLALTRSQVENRYLNLTAVEMALYQDMLSDLLFLSPMRRSYQEMLQRNRKGQSALWKHGISGDRPMVLLSLDKTGRMDILYEVLRAHEYWRLMDMKVDLVILDEEAHSYHLPLHNLISDIVLSRQTHDVLNRPGDVFILDKTQMTEADVMLLFAAARIILSGDGRNMAEQTQDRPNRQWPERLIHRAHATVFPSPALKEPEWLKHNGLGGFRPDGQEYVIRLDKGQQTPAPWINVIANPSFGFLVSESGSGYVWSQNSREYKLTPWSNDAVSDPPGEVIYIGDTDSGDLWTPTALPIREPEPYLIRHGFGYSAFEHNSHGIEQWMTQHVPVDAPVKVTLLGLRNVTDQRRHLTLTYYMRPVLGVSDQVTAPHIRSRMGASGCLLMENSWQEEFADTVCFMDTSVPIRTVTSDRTEFFGAGDLRAPESLERERLSCQVGTGFDPCGAIQVKVTLEPNERREIVFLLGAEKSLDAAEALAAMYSSVEKAHQSLAQVKAFWKEKMNIVKVKTPGMAMDLMLDGWLPYQVISCRLWARSGFYQAGGAFGFRDQLQDSLSMAPIWPEITRAQILLHAAHQFTEGDVQHWWHEPEGKGTRTRISDDLLWLPYVTAEYIRISGDTAILHEIIPFLDEPVLSEFEEERYGRPKISAETGTLFDHCVRAVAHALRFGAHGLPLIGTGDWNDGMNAVGNKGRGESVWLGWFLLTVLDAMIPFCEQMEQPEQAERYQDIRDTLIAAMEREAWDGAWYRRAWFDNGQMLGSAQNCECKIDAIAQTWAVISGAGNPERAVQAMHALDDWLVRREDGLVKLLTPPFGDGELEPGYIKGYLPGVRENGGQYTHAAVWAVIAFAMMGEGDKAWELYELINPINHTGNGRDCARYKAEPYVMAADVYAVHPHAGRGGWSWYTGSAGWMYRAGLEYLLGYRKTGNAIVMDPCIPRKWTAYDIRCKHGDTIHAIRVLNPNGVSRGVASMLVDGVPVEGNRFELAEDGKQHEIEVTLG